MKRGMIFFAVFFLFFLSSCQVQSQQLPSLLPEHAVVPVEEKVVVAPEPVVVIVEDKPVVENPVCYKQKEGDKDTDGLSDYDELVLYRTSPLLADMDHDLLTDFAEVKTYKTSPRRSDSDLDGLRDSDEILEYKTNPLLMDTDGDGLLDGEEVLTYATDPLVQDTDGDGWFDGAEIRLQKSPLDALSVGADDDHDLLDDAWEKAMTFDQSSVSFAGEEDVDLEVHQGSPPNQIKKGDGLTNVQEQMWGTYPLKGDTDKDGLLDGDEVLVYKTHPRLEDTDGDGWSDGREVKEFHMNPLDVRDRPYLSLQENEVSQGYAQGVTSQQLVGYWRGQEPSFIDYEYADLLQQCQKRFSTHLTVKRPQY